MIIETKFTGFNGLIGQINKYYDRVLIVTNELAIETRNEILERVASGRNTDGSVRRSRSKTSIGSKYSKSYAGLRRRKGLSLNPMNLKVTGGLYNSFRVRRSNSGRSRSFEIYFTKNKVKGRDINYNELAGILQFQSQWKYAIGISFYPSKQEINRLRSKWLRATKK